MNATLAADASGLESHLQAEPMTDCIPRRSLRSSRRMWTLNLGIFIGVGLLFSMVVPSREALFVPGELSAQHAQILNNKLVADRCSLCHPASHGNFFSSSVSAQQDELCLQCHTSHLPDAELRSPHDLPFEQLIALGNSSQAQTPVQTVSSTPKPIDWKNVDLSCARCHREHHGRNADLKELGGTHCQACHRQQFEAFASGHPEFDDFPISLPNKLSFDHNSHSVKHFPQKNRQFDCRSCHVDSARSGAIGSVFRTLGFDKACAECHAAPIKASTVDGWTLLQIPSIDLNDTMNSAEGLSDWPDGARFGYEGQLSPAVRVLLTSDATTERALAAIPESGRLVDVPAAQRAPVAKELAKAIRKLVDETARDGQAVWRNRITAALSQKLGRKLEASEMELVNQTCAGLPPDLFRQIMSGWFKSRASLAGAETAPAHSTDPDIFRLASQSDELLRGPRATKNSPAKKLTKIRGATHVSEGGWYLNADILSVQYMPSGHADPILAGWTQIVSALEGQNLAKQIPGGCTQCHNLPSGIHNVATNPWQVSPRPANIRPFTKFSHEPHLTISAINDCRFCHVLTQSPTISDTGIQLVASPGGQPTSHVHGEQFQKMKLNQCTSCHRPEGANDSCTQCHNYHVGQAGLLWNQVDREDTLGAKKPSIK